MKLRQEVLAMVGALLGLNLLMTFGAVALLSRMAPAVQTILRQNDDSLRAGEVIVIELALLGDAPSTAPVRRRVLTALSDAQRNVTEPEERAPLSEIEQHIEAALGGDAAARGRVVGGVRQLLDVNRAAMARGGNNAEHMGNSGAWAVVILGVLFFALSLAVLGRLQRRFLDPLVELHDTLNAASQGDRFRRCRKQDAPVELNHVAATVNQLLDERTATQPNVPVRSA